MPANWEWQDDDGNWMPYHHADNVVIEKAFQTKAPTFKTTDLSFNAGYNSVYQYDFGKLTQTNADSGRVRKLRRIETGGDEDELGFIAIMKEASVVGGVVAGSAPAPTAVGDAPTVVDEDVATEDDEEHLAKKKTKFELDLPPMAFVPAGDDDEDDSAVAAAPAAKATPTLDAAASALITVDPTVAAAQSTLGAQSKRRQKFDLGPVGKDPHGKSCFEKMLWREKQLSGEWSVFYHSYSYAALLYEVQAAVAAVLFRFKSEYASLPRLLKKPYDDLPDADALLKLFPKMKGRDHDPRFRAVAISVTTSLLAMDSEAPPKNVFLHGYSCADMSFFGVLENLLVSCGVPSKDKTDLAKQIVTLSAKHGLDVSQFKGKPCKSGRAGHMLQIFVKRSAVNKYAYAALPFGVKDAKRKDLEAALEADGPIQGQARVVTNPSVFMRGGAVRMYVYSADPTFHGNRPAFQKEMTALLHPVIGHKAVRLKAAEGIYGGKVPSWFNPDDCEDQKKP